MSIFRELVVSSAYFSFLLLLLLCRVCETGSDNQPLSDNQQTTCEYFVDSLFEEAQKVGARCLSPTDQKKQVNVHNFCLCQSFSKCGPFRKSAWGQNFFTMIARYYLPCHHVWLCTSTAEAVVGRRAAGTWEGIKAVAPNCAGHYCIRYLRREDKR